MADPSMDLEPDLSGRILDRYKLFRRLGIGGMGAVYEAEHTTLEKRVAVKLLRHEFTLQDIARKRFLREAKAATRVKHPNVVDISDFGQTPEGQVYFVMELLDGRDLGDLVKETPRIPWERAKAILLQVGSALEAAHAQGIIHRDMKPSNCFLVDLPGRPDVDFIKVLDFGIAKFAGGSGNKEETEGLTSTDEVFGTVAYMSPEMAQGTTNDLRSDIYATGVMMYRMLTGALPFSEGNAFQILSQHIGVAPPSPRSKEPSIPEGVEAIILKALQKDARYRFQSMSEFLEALERGDVPPTDEATVVQSPVSTPPAGEVTEVLPGVMAAAPVSTGATMMLEASASSSSGSTVVMDTHPSQPITASGPSGTVVFPGGTNATQLAALAATLGTGTITSPPKGRTLPVALLVVSIVGVLVGAVALGVYIARGQGDAPIAAGPTEDPSTVDVASVPGPVPTSAEEKTAIEAPVPTPAAVESEATAVLEQPPELAEPPPEDVEVKKEEPAPEKSSRARAAKKKPKSDAEVVARLRRKMKARCAVDGSTAVRLEGLINAEGKVQGAMATPKAGPGTCAEKILRTARFAPRRGSKVMPMFTVDL